MCTQTDLPGEFAKRGSLPLPVGTQPHAEFGLCVNWMHVASTADRSTGSTGRSTPPDHRASQPRGTGRSCRQARRWVIGGLLAMLAACSAGSPATPPAPAPEQVNPADPLHGCAGHAVLRDSQVEPSLAVDPSAPGVLAVWQQDRLSTGAALGIVAESSRDGGQSWSGGQLPGLTRCDGGQYTVVSDPTAGIGPTGSRYVLSIAVDDRTGHQAILLSRAEQGSRSWLPPVTVTATRSGHDILDKPTLLADPAHAQVLYAAWEDYPVRQGAGPPRRDTSYVARSADGGAHWSRPIPAYGADSESQDQQLLALPGDRLADVFVDAFRLAPDPRHTVTARLAVETSTDQGKSWSRAETIADFPFTVAADQESGRAIRASGQDIAAAAAPSGQLWVAWTVDWAGNSRIEVSHSTTTGWSAPTGVAASPDALFLPELAVSANGTVALTWYADQSNAGTRRGIPTVVDAAIQPPDSRWKTTRIAGPFDLALAPSSNYGLFVGDYTGLAAGSCGYRALLSVPGPRPGTATATLAGFGCHR
jgi:hypothetical protein